MVGKELYYVAQAVLDGKTSGDGSFTRKCEALLRERFSANDVLLTTSCTSALEMAAMLIRIGEGDEVIMPSFTFVSTANAFVGRGARPVFVDVRDDTLNLDERLLEDAITPRTKAIVVVHYGGVACAMDEIRSIAEKHGLLVIEDAAQGVNAQYKGRYLGTIGDLGTYSFHETKNYICGEGGALVVPDDRFSNRPEIIRQKGTDRCGFLRGEVDKYTWTDIGSSFAPSDILAAFLYAQLEHMDVITEGRESRYQLYMDLLAPLAEREVLRLPVIPEACTSNYALFFILLSDPAARAALIEHLKDYGIDAVFHYVPLHTSPMGREYGNTPGMLPVTEVSSERLLRLPLYQSLHRDEQVYVARALFDFFGVEEGRP